MVFLVVLRHKLMLHALKAINLPLNYSYIPSFYFKYLIELGSDALWAWDALWWMTFYYLFISLLVIVPLWFSLIHDSVLLGCIYIYISWNWFICFLLEVILLINSVWQRPTFYRTGFVLSLHMTKEKGENSEGSYIGTNIIHYGSTLRT